MKLYFNDLFGDHRKTVIGMIHLAGRDQREKVDRALEEIKIYTEEELDGAIVEDYHGSLEDVGAVLIALENESRHINIGVNTLKDPYLAFELADRYGAGFVQFDTIQASDGSAENNHRFNEKKYLEMRDRYPKIIVLGGVRFKYIPLTGRSLEEDIIDCMSKCEAIVTTGEGTGIETPAQKLRYFKGVMVDFPLIAGAGVNDRNVRDQLMIADGAIVGSYFKGGETHNNVSKDLVRKLVNNIPHY